MVDPLVQIDRAQWSNLLQFELTYTLIRWNKFEWSKCYLFSGIHLYTNGQKLQIDGRTYYVAEKNLETKQITVVSYLPTFNSSSSLPTWFIGFTKIICS